MILGEGLGIGWKWWKGRWDIVMGVLCNVVLGQNAL